MRKTILIGTICSRIFFDRHAFHRASGALSGLRFSGLRFAPPENDEVSRFPFTQFPKNRRKSAASLLGRRRNRVFVKCRPCAQSSRP
ncbi:hypothetical protein BOS5A_231038 [Bosea sp. EC-HK365B]|nr:hypothetical protein BOSE7B_50384 [Bosea sp. 7B]CAD5299767.1 hypothetical protein BOSE21B_91111 [Bosea sp. 21B]VVT61761.1 hypothetical protein BOS5A_231038 [Bosea sp. EC-HK365B]VXB03397.1 hypothetical protein BOSE127_100052 [Bosea sp. 127]